MTIVTQRSVGEDNQRGEWTFRHEATFSTCSHPQHGTRQISGPIRDFWLKGLIPRIGFPMSDMEEVNVGGRPVRVVHFERGDVFWDTYTETFFYQLTAQPETLLQSLAIALFGKWESPFEPGVVGVHAALLPTNEVLLWTYEDLYHDHEHAPDDKKLQPNMEWSILDLATGKQTISKATNVRNQFCSGHCLLGNGFVLAVGGERHTPPNDKTLRLFDPYTREWSDLQDLPFGRYYPSVVTVQAANGSSRGLIVGGEDTTKPVPESYNYNVQHVNPSGTTSELYAFDPEMTMLNPDAPFGLEWDGLKNSHATDYPFVFVLPGGRLFVHCEFKSRIVDIATLDFATAKKATAVDESSRTYPSEGTAVLLPLRPTGKMPYHARVLVMGGGNGGGTAKSTCEILDVGLMTQPKWKPAASMKHPRVMGDAVLLPDGKVLLVNGSSSGQTGGATSPVYEAELYDPDKDTWTTLASMHVDRLYHATALLLPDGRVLTAGTDREWNAAGTAFDKAHTELEVFSPPYLFAGPRPTITSCPPTIGYGTKFDVGTEEAETIQAAVLVRNGSCTHSFNSDQRLVEMKVLQRFDPKLLITTSKMHIGSPGGGIFSAPDQVLEWPTNFVFSRGIELKAPPDAFVAPPGYYMLFLLSDKSVPSVARFVQVG